MRTFLPQEYFKDHLAVRKKLVNCGILAFDLLLLPQGQYAVDPASVAVVYGGFEGQSGDAKRE